MLKVFAALTKHHDDQEGEVRMGAHLIDGEFQSDKYPSTPRGKVPLSVKDVTAQDLLWIYAQRRRVVDAEFADDLETALVAAGYSPTGETGTYARLCELADARFRELAVRLVASGPKAGAVSASECHEISEGLINVLDEIDRLRYGGNSL